MTIEEMTEAAKALAKAINKEVYVTKLMGGHFAFPKDEVIALTLERDRYCSEVMVKPDGTILECDQLC